MKGYILYKNSNTNGKDLIDCKGCGERKEHHAKGMCYRCYKKFSWKPKKIKCKNCGKIKDHHAFGLCNSCNNKLHHYDTILEHNAKKNFGINRSTFVELTKECAVCNFSKIVELHHLDLNKKNNSKENLVPLCPNCHKLIHGYKYFDEIKNKLKDKGYNVSGTRPQP